MTISGVDKLKARGLGLEKGHAVDFSQGCNYLTLNYPDGKGGEQNFQHSKLGF
jgi:hypothetical protein